MSMHPSTEASVLGRLDRITVATRSHRKWVLILGLFFFFDSVDNAMFGYTALAFRQEWGLSVGDISVGTAATFTGMMVGAFVGGRLGDRIGRRPIIFAGVLIFSVASLITAVAPSYGFMIACRVVVGIGLQAMLGALLVYMNENFPPGKRGRYVALVVFAGTAAAPAVALLSAVVVPIAPGAWRWMYVVGAVGSVGLLAWRFVPESVRWLVARGRVAEAERIVERLESEAVTRHGPLPPPVDVTAVVAEVPGSIGELLRRRGGNFAVVAGAFALLVLVSYGYNQWTPTLLSERGFDTAEALTFSAIIILGAPCGALLSTIVIDRFERKFVIIGFSLVLAVAVTVFGLTSGTVALIVAGTVVSALTQLLTAVFYTYGPELFPTHVRAVGWGAAGGVARLAGIVSGPLIALVVTIAGFTGASLYLAAVGVLMCLVVALGPRTRVALPGSANAGAVRTLAEPGTDAAGRG